MNKMPWAYTQRRYAKILLVLDNGYNPTTYIHMNLSEASTLLIYLFWDLGIELLLAAKRRYENLVMRATGYP
jgi:hypothetical protein